MDSTLDLGGIMRTVPVFRELAATELEQLTSALTERSTTAGQIVVKEGDSTREFFLVLDGEFQVFVRQQSIDFEKQLRQLGRGSYFGEISIFTGDHRTASVRATTNGRVAVLNQSSLHNKSLRSISLLGGFPPMLSRIRLFILTLASFALCIHPTSGAPGTGLPFPPGTSLAEARKGFVTKLVRKEHGSDAPDKPPADLFQLVQYHSPAGKLAAYLSVPPKDNAKHPAIIWITGGFDNDIGDTAWVPAKPENDQSASAFRKAGLVMMYPSLRGGNSNPGFKECFFGEVDDVLSAADFLARQDFVDRKRIYLGGHSTGGTLVLLCAESSNRFRAVLSFGPVAGASAYGRKNLTFDLSNKMEVYLRSPVLFLDSIQSPVLVMEGDSPPGNISALREMARVSTNAKISFHPVPGLSHFSELAPVTELLAEKLMRDGGPTANVQVTDAELAGLGRAGK